MGATLAIIFVLFGRHKETYGLYFSGNKTISGRRMKIKHAIVFVLSILSISCVVYFTLLPESEDTVKEDTGRSRDETERFMREIGYVQ